MMDIDKSLPKVDDGIKLEEMESKEMNDGNFYVKREIQGCKNCLEWEERFSSLKSEFGKKIKELESLEGKLSALQLVKLVLEDEVQSLRARNEELEERVICTVDGKKATGGVGKGVESVVDLTDDANEDKVMELIIENKVLDCEKKRTEREVDVWKTKCKELESRVILLEQRLTGVAECVLTVNMEEGLTSPGAGVKEISEATELTGGVDGAVTPLVDTSINLVQIEGGKRGMPCKSDVESCSQARKQLIFGEERSLDKKIAPTTPAGVRPAYLSIIDISDGEGEEDATHLSTINIQASKKACESTDYGEGITLPEKLNSSKRDLTRALHGSDEGVTGQDGIAPSMSTPKRKRTSNIVTSDSESNGDDYFPISRLRTNYRTASPSQDEQGVSVVRRRLVTLRKLKEGETSKKSSRCNSKRIQTGHLCGIPTNKLSSDDETEADELDSEAGSLNEFIVGDSDSSEGNSDTKHDDTFNSDGPLSSDDFSAESSDASDGNINYEDIIASIGRRKVHKVKWEFEADMLADIGKDPELCMKAVCALYRQQTSDEKFHKATIVSNQRGFSQSDAYRGTKLGDFLTDGDPQGMLKKSVEELEEYDLEGLERCRSLAAKYSEQLFRLFQNKEDPLWP